MTPLVENVTYLLSIGTIILQVFSVVALIFFLTKKENRLLEKYSPLLIFILSLAGVISSLFYSDYAGFLPCSICWYARIALYPQVLILAIAYYKKGFKHAMDYILFWLKLFSVSCQRYCHYLS